MSKATKPCADRVITKPLDRPEEVRIKNILLVPSATSLLAPTITLPVAFVADGVAVAVGVEVGADVGIVTPLFHTIFLPDLMAVYFFPRHTIVCPTFLGTRVGPVAANAAPPIKEVSAPVTPASICRLEIMG
ncbi:MAG: hypothetical protein CK545_02515 [Actinobacteria bacterium]|nr:MAG: hypothetical protein CK545_02515 [Actinomycetota bacterium]